LRRKGKPVTHRNDEGKLSHAVQGMIMFYLPW